MIYSRLDPTTPRTDNMRGVRWGSFFAAWSVILIAAVVAWTFLGMYALVIAAAGAAASIPLASFDQRDAIVVAAAIALTFLVLAVVVAAAAGGD